MTTGISYFAGLCLLIFVGFIIWLVEQVRKVGESECLRVRGMRQALKMQKSIGRRR